MLFFEPLCLYLIHSVFQCSVDCRRVIFSNSSDFFKVEVIYRMDCLFFYYNIISSNKKMFYLKKDGEKLGNPGRRLKYPKVLKNVLTILRQEIFGRAWWIFKIGFPTMDFQAWISNSRIFKIVQNHHERCFQDSFATSNIFSRQVW